MEDIDQIVEKPVAGEEASISEATPEEPKATEEAETPVTESTEEVAEETKAETEDAPKKGAQRRIRELNAKAKSAEEKAKGLEARLAELTGQVGQPEQQAPYQPQVEPGAELTSDQYKMDVTRTAESLVNLRLKQYEAVNRINSEANQVMSKYPQLNPDSDQFDQLLSDSVTEATLAHVKANPYSASPKQFVEKLMKPYLRSVTKEVGKATENIAKQVSEAATRPTSISTKGGKTDNEKSVKELEEELGFFN